MELRRGDFPRALAFADRGLALTNTSQSSQWAWTFRFLRSEVLLFQRQTRDVMPLLAEPLPDTSAFAALRARQKYLEGAAQLTLDRQPDALRALDDARQQAVSAGAADVLLDVEALQAQIALRQGKWDDAETTLSGVLARATRDLDRYHEAVALTALGMSRLRRNRFDEALPFFQRVLARTELEPLLVYGTARRNAAICYSRLGDLDRALDVQRREVAADETAGPRLYFEQALGETGNSYVLKGDIATGRTYLERALRVATEAGLSSDAALWAGNLASASADAGEWDAAARYNAEAIRLKEASHATTLVYNTLNSARIAAGLGQTADAAALYKAALGAAQEDPAVLWDAHAGLGRLDHRAGRSRAAAAHFDTALAGIERTRSDLLKPEYKLTYLTHLIGFYQEYVDTLMQQGQVDRALEVADSSRARVLTERFGVAPTARSSAAGFRRLAGTSQSVLVSYWLAPVRSYAWVVTPRATRSVVLPPAAEIAPLVQEYQHLLEGSIGDPLGATDSAGARLYDALIAPIAAWVPRGSSVLIVPDGPLHGLNLETLPTGGAQSHYWIEDVTVAVVPSLSALASMPAAATPGAAGSGSLLLIGDPITGDPAFPRLRHAAAEIAAIAAAVGRSDTVVYSGSGASPSAYRAAHPERFSMIHFAAHATALRESPLDSAVVLSPADNRYKLYARDLFEQPLRADLVTISACRSAGARVYAGEGLVGFAWGFLRAGARHVVAGLWDVDDESTARLMEALYKRLAGGDSPAVALRAAKLSLLQSGGAFAKPYYWGAFEVFSGAR